MILGAALQVQHVAAHERRVVFGDGPDRGFEPGRLGRESRNDRCHQHASLDTRLAKLSDGAQTLKRVRRAGFERGPCAFINRWHADTHRAAGFLPKFGQQISVTDDHRTLRDETDRCSRGDERLQRAARQLVVTFDRLVGIGRGADGHLLARPRRLVELAAQHFRKIRLHEDDRREVIARPQLELRLIPAREAVVAGVRAAAIRVQRPVEGHALDGIERGPASHFLIARRVRAALRLVERGVLAVVTDPERERPGRGRFRSQVEE